MDLKPVFSTNKTDIQVQLKLCIISSTMVFLGGQFKCYKKKTLVNIFGGREEGGVLQLKKAAM